MKVLNKGWAILGLVLTALSACEQDYYDKGEGKYSLMRADLCIVHTDGEKNVHYAVIDDGDSLLLTEPYSAKWLSTADSTYRALIYYDLPTEETDSKAKVVSLSRIPSANIHRPDYFKKGIKTDPVGFESTWIGKNRRYLNIGLILMMGESNNEKATHTLGIVGDTLMHNPDGTATYHLRLFHDQGEVPEYYSQRTYFSIPLQGLSTDSIAIKINTYNGIIEKRLAVSP